tara:strand:- start:52 stop:333 length:282 start_codon:yes stop_codon:yes gene_type:complete
MSKDRTITLSKHEVVLDKMFAEDTWELAFGDGAWENQYEDEDVYQKLKEYEQKALAWDTMWEEHQPNEDDEDTQEDYDLREKMGTYLGSCSNG